MQNRHSAPAVPLSVCQAGTHGHGTAGARDCRHSLAAPKSPLCPRCYPQYPVPICQQMALLICLDCPQRRCALQGAVSKGGTLAVPPSVMGRLSPFTHWSHRKGYDFSRAHTPRETRNVKNRQKCPLMAVAWAAGGLGHHLPVYQELSAMAHHLQALHTLPRLK